MSSFSDLPDFTNPSSDRSYHVRMGRPPDASLLPEVERAAAEIFRQLPQLAFLADDEPAVSETKHLACIKAGTCWVAADREDQPVGFLSAESQGRDLHILEVSVKPVAQGRGVGRALIAAACHFASEHTYQRITLTTFLNVPWNRPFYEKLGFRLVERSEPECRLQSLVHEEEASGLPVGSRCAMQLVL
ncbi:acetyltransferase [Acetobacter indonesiensis NRIC 0313]|uniref:Acetyltransferase n=2 Tax=Acetobacter indonesiensis TaxID=104101 RepID=A0A6N3T567_9PROT|nr:GNAT family N-acetyltransferase [Acetobacter indonesiensis]GAN64377.1 acetyltransferase [Acetobacter indonesiensis]GBQ55910.1 acetyltransferase [Acetobacter indonesiensis NRIC 0313]GEN04421.1 N-acetyltransferase GCN5 [Acetobacter indonesiensis]